jgi:hypothetical protein
MDRTACTELQCLYKGAIYFYLFIKIMKGGGNKEKTLRRRGIRKIKGNDDEVISRYK